MITYKVTVDKYGNRRWFNEIDEYHRLDGPALEWANGKNEWYILDVYYTEEQFKAKIDAMNRPCKGKKIVVDGVEYTLA